MTDVHMTAHKCAEVLEHLSLALGDAAVMGAVIGDQTYDALYDSIKKIDNLGLWLLAKNGSLVGAELCNECGDVVGVVTAVGTDLMITVDGYGTLHLDDVSPGHLFFRKPGSGQWFDLATVQLLRVSSTQN